jgi:hypothetical protein
LIDTHHADFGQCVAAVRRDSQCRHGKKSQLVAGRVIGNDRDTLLCVPRHSPGGGSRGCDARPRRKPPLLQRCDNGLGQLFLARIEVRTSGDVQQQSVGVIRRDHGRKAKRPLHQPVEGAFDILGFVWRDPHRPTGQQGPRMRHGHPHVHSGIVGDFASIRDALHAAIGSDEQNGFWIW